MSGTENPAFEGHELDALEAGHRSIGSISYKEKDDQQESSSCLTSGRNVLESFLSKHRKAFKICLAIAFNLAVLVYFVFATIYWKNHNSKDGLDWCDGYGMLLLIMGFAYGGIFYSRIIKRYFGKIIVSCFRPLGNCSRRIRSTRYGGIIGKAVIYLSILAAIIVFLICDTIDSQERLMSVIGVVTLLTLGWIFSKHPGHINWRPIFCGLILQFTLGLFIIRWSVGRAIAQCLSEKVTTFLDFAKNGAAFIFSEDLVSNGVFAFAVLPVIYYFSFIIQILYYLGVMQWVILKLGWALQTIMGTTLCESINCAANTFIGMSESPLLIKPYINQLTTSELHAIMTSGFASVSGTVLAAYIGFGAQPVHLLTASLMSAPAALCYSKLFYPETEKSLTSLHNIKLEKSQDTSLLDAASKGAVAGIPMVLGIVANIVAFVSFVSLINAIISWLGFLVGYEDLSFELILSRVFMPLSWVIGVPWDKCEAVGTLIGLKTVVNEFVAYQKLGEFKRAGVLYGRTEAIATYAICGFANPGSVGIMLGALSTLAPEKKNQITGAIARAFIAGCAVCFLTASIAGMLMNDDFFVSNLNVSTVATTQIAGDFVTVS